MNIHRLAISPLAFSILFLSATLPVVVEASAAETAPKVTVRSGTEETGTGKTPEADRGAGTLTAREKADDIGKRAETTSGKTRSEAFDRNPKMAVVRFEYSDCVLRPPASAKAYSERELYSMLLALSDSAAKAAKPYVESRNDLDSGAREAATRIVDLNEEESERIREIMLKGKMDFDSRVGGFADEVTAGIAPARFEGAAGRNLFPFAARHHAAVIVLALEALEFSHSEDARELAHDLIVDHTAALAEVKELQQEK